MAPMPSSSDKRCTDSPWVSSVMLLSAGILLCDEILNSFSCLIWVSDPGCGLDSIDTVPVDATEDLSSADFSAPSLCPSDLTEDCELSGVKFNTVSGFTCSGWLFTQGVGPPTGTNAGMGDNGSSSFLTVLPSLSSTPESVLVSSELWVLLEVSATVDKVFVDAGAFLPCILLLESPGPSRERGGVEGLSCFTLKSPFWAALPSSACPFTTACPSLFITLSHSPFFVGKVSSTVLFSSTAGRTEDSTVVLVLVKLLVLRDSFQHFKSGWDGFL